MNRCHCQSPPVWADAGSCRSGSPAANLSQPGMQGNLLGLFALRSRTALLQSGLPPRSQVPPAPRCQSPTSRESGRPARSSRPATCLPATSRVLSRDGSRFRFGHFSGTIRLWRNDHDVGWCPAVIEVARRHGKATRSLAALLDLRSARPLRRSFPSDSPKKVSSHDHS